jgi:SAM-dependent methyltransferase
MNNHRNYFYQNYHSKFNSQIAKVDAKVIESLFYHYDIKLLPILKNFSQDSRILELGCGPGYLLDYLKLKGFKNLIGIDISAEQIEIAKSKNHNVLLADVFEFLKNSSENYDIVFAFDFIEHFTKDELVELTSLISNVLNKDGLFILRTPNGQGFFPGDIIYGDLTHQTIFNPNSVIQLLSSNGFSEFIFIENLPVAKDLKGFIRLILWKFIRLILNAAKIIESGAGQIIWTKDFYCIAKKLNV